MNRIFFFIFAFSMSSFALAERFQDRFHSLDEGKPGEEHLLFLESGRVVFVPPDKVNGFLEKLYGGEKLEIVTGKRGTLKSMKVIFDPEVKEEDELPETSGIIESEPTVLPDHDAAYRIFRNMNRTYKNKTECSDRAHVWSYEEWKKNGLIQNKVFLFFTKTYIRRYRFYWWFHVSPYTLVQHEDSVVEHVMDRRYTRAPLHMKSWTDVFIRSKRTCPESTYRHYRANRYGSEHCYLVKVPMYYRLPLHVRNMEDSGIIKTRFSSGEVNFSYRAFRQRQAR